MNDYDSASAVRQDAMEIANLVAAQTVLDRLNGKEPAPYLVKAGEAARDVMLRAGQIEAVEPEPMVAAMEWIDQVEFARRRQLRLRMQALRSKGASR